MERLIPAGALPHFDAKDVAFSRLGVGFEKLDRDVFNPEPPLADNPLRTLKNVILTPHLAGLANNGLRRIGAHSVDEIERFLNGEPMHCEVRKEMLATMA